jgi:hypothetical protein
MVDFTTLASAMALLLVTITSFRITVSMQIQL